MVDWTCSHFQPTKARPETPPPSTSCGPVAGSTVACIIIILSRSELEVRKSRARDRADLFGLTVTPVSFVQLIQKDMHNCGLNIETEKTIGLHIG